LISEVETAKAVNGLGARGIITGGGSLGLVHPVKKRIRKIIKGKRSALMMGLNDESK